MSLASWGRGFLLFQSLVGLGQMVDRDTKYYQAWHYSRQVGKPLLIVGGPYGSNITGHLFRFKAHGCGDVCLDLDPFACQGCPFTPGDVRDIPYADGYFGAVFVSHVLEHLPSAQDAIQAWQELHRVSDRVFAAYPSKLSAWAWLHPGHHLWVRAEGDTLYVEERGR